jgi:GxxExxY protein
MTVHKTLGKGFQEVIYQRALAIEMRLSDIHFQREFEMPIFTEKNKSAREESIFLWEVLYR